MQVLYKDILCILDNYVDDVSYVRNNSWNP